MLRFYVNSTVLALIVLGLSVGTESCMVRKNYVVSREEIKPKMTPGEIIVMNLKDHADVCSVFPGNSHAASASE